MFIDILLWVLRCITHLCIGFYPAFSRQAKASKLSLVIWLNENVGFAFVFSPWQGIQASLNSLLIWLNENVLGCLNCEKGGRDAALMTIVCLCLPFFGVGVAVFNLRQLWFSQEPHASSRLWRIRRFVHICCQWSRIWSLVLWILVPHEVCAL